MVVKSFYRVIYRWAGVTRRFLESSLTAMYGTWKVLIKLTLPHSVAKRPSGGAVKGPQGSLDNRMISLDWRRHWSLNVDPGKSLSCIDVMDGRSWFGITLNDKDNRTHLCSGL